MPLDAAPLSSSEFNAMMRGAAPFEPAPVVAVGVSGGADSMALTLLAADWARRQGGTAVALTVDHGLRPGARAEARRVADWLADREIEHHALRWTGTKPRTGVQAAARDARYRLLTGWCRRHGVLHLLLAHHREDQAETVVMRLARGSGIDGLAGMPGISETPWLRILRPFLATPRDRLRATLKAKKQPWIEDPSNQDPAFTRVRVRAALSAAADDSPGIDRLAETGRKLGLARAALARQTAELLARAVTIHPSGYCMVDHAAFASAPQDVARRALSRTVACIGGLAYPPRRDRLDRLYETLVDGAPARARTLGGCLISPTRGRVLIAREPGAVHPPARPGPGGETIWDGRFHIIVRGGQASRLRVGALGRDGWIEIAARMPEVRKTAIPAPVRPSLPALRDGRGVIEVPHIGYRRPENRRQTAGKRPEIKKMRFLTANPLASAEFSVV